LRTVWVIFTSGHGRRVVTNDTTPQQQDRRRHAQRGKRKERIAAVDEAVETIAAPAGLRARTIRRR
jgi:hypothetical protein